MSSANKRTRKRNAVILLDSDSEVEAAPAKRKATSALPKIKKEQKLVKPNTKKSQQANHNEEFDEKSEVPSNGVIKSGKRRVQSPPKAGTSSEQSTSTQTLLGKSDACHSQANETFWSDEALLCELKNIDYQTSVNIVKLFDAGNTIPFMCRYRRDMINHLDADEMRGIKAAYNQIKNIRARALVVTKELEKKNLLNDTLQHEILSAKSVDAIDHVYAPFKWATKGSLHERAKALGLSDVAEEIMNNSGYMPVIGKYVNSRVKGAESLLKVTEGIKNIISYVFSKDIDVLEAIQAIVVRDDIRINSVENVKETGLYHKAADKKPKDRTENPQKFENYFRFSSFATSLHPHQILAINRGESLKYLNVKVVLPETVPDELERVLDKKFRISDGQCNKRAELLSDVFKDTYVKKFKPLIRRNVRSHLKTFADKISVEVFAKNLKQLLLTHPFKGHKILGIDPGFRNGCKMALISEQNDVLATATIYPHTPKSPAALSNYEHEVVDLMQKHRCELIAIGNGTACRETEMWIANMIGRDLFHSKSVRYCVVNENGASIYSCSDVAKREFPDMDINIISAVSIARRFSDPLAELVKIEPKHMGVGMYQHDINEKYLLETLEEVVMECVSFVGVDINTASISLLKYIAGLGASRAENIIKYRAENGPFQTRDDIKKVKSIGRRTFEQCAGFIRIDPVTSKAPTKFNMLDATWVHPESYKITKKLLTNWKLRVDDIGTAAFIQLINERQANSSIDDIAKKHSASTEQISSIMEALSRERCRDYRDDSNIHPMIKQELFKLADLQNDQILMGTARNVTTFGCFVDIGVEQDGLIHTSKMAGATLNLGDRVMVRVLDVDVPRKRIQLILECVL